MRIKLEMPDKILFSTEIEILVQHINYGNHLGNDSVLSIIHESRVRFFHHLGHSEKSIDGTGVIMTDAVINYLSEGFYGHKLKIDIGVKDITPKIFDIYYEIENKTTNKKLAIAKTGIFGYDYTTTKTQEFSSKFIEIIS